MDVVISFSDPGAVPGASTNSEFQAAGSRCQGRAAARPPLDQKGEIYVLPKDERRRWREAVKSLDEKWVADLEAKKLPAKALLSEARALSAKYGEAE